MTDTIGRWGKARLKPQRDTLMHTRGKQLWPSNDLFQLTKAESISSFGFTEE